MFVMQKNYSKWFFIENSIWNNVFSKEKRLYVPEIVSINDFNEIKLQDDKEKIAFEDFDFKWNLITAYWLKNFYRIFWKQKEIILFDNHNHAFYFWYEARNRGIIGDNNILVHIDEHSDMKDDGEYLLKPNSHNLNDVFDFTNFVLNVWNYIIPTVKEWIIWEVIQIRSEENLNNWFVLPEKKGIILNLDLDFFEPNLDYINYELKKKFILDIAKKADVITVATSPFFVNQELALEVFKEIFW